MKNENISLDNKLTCRTSQRPQTQKKKNNKKFAIQKYNNYNIPLNNNNIPNKNNYNSNQYNININNLINNQIKNPTKIIGKIQNINKYKKSINKIHNTHNNYIYFNDYKTNLVEYQDKPCTPILKNQNDYFQYFINNNINEKKNNNNINIKREKSWNNIENINHRRSKSTNKPIVKSEHLKNKKNSVKLNNNKSNEKIKKFPSFINRNKKDINKNDNSLMNNKNNIHNIIPPNTKNINNINNFFNNNPKDKNEINTKINNKIYGLEINNNIKNNNNIIVDSKNSINYNLNRQINTKTPPYISYAMHEHPNTEYRKQMEDFHNFKFLSIKNFYFNYFSIFDGHSGTEVPIFLRDNFHKYLENELESKSFSSDYESNNQIIINSIKDSFERIDKDIINNNNFKKENGSTGTIILLYRDINNPLRKILICANVGDSKGYIINKNNIKQITNDHNCDNENEVTRIRNSGGIVFQGRVFGSLMLTRSFGDKEFKQTGGVLATPHIFCDTIKDNDLYAIIASDGVWDIISQEQLFQLSKTNMSSKDFSKKIVITAMEGGTRDNVSCFVIKLNNN